MASTSYTYELTPGRTRFPVSFEYLARRFVRVTLVGQARLPLVLTVDFRFISKMEIEVTTPIIQGEYETIEIRRETSAEDRLVNFTDGSILRSQDLNISQIQAIHIAEEARGFAESSMTQDGISWNALGFPIVNVGDPMGDTDAVNVTYVKDSLEYTLRSSTKLNLIPNDRYNKILGFDPQGHPVAVIPSMGSSIELELSLAAKSAPEGAAKIGVDGRWLNEYLKQMGFYRTIEYYGPTSTPQETLTTLQLAFNKSAADGFLLTAAKRRYTIDLSQRGLTFPSGFRCDLGGAVIARATGNKTPHDMLVNADTVNGNSGFDIRGLVLDGAAQVDSLTNAAVSHRFSGLSITKGEGKLTDVTAMRTVNGEFQPEGARGGIFLKDSVFIDCERIEANQNIGTGLLTNGGRGRISGFRSEANTGSGISGDQPYWIMSDLSSKGSGYSGISLNGPGWIADGIRATGAPVGFAGVNFGHATPETSHGIDCVASNVVAEDNAGWGINATSCPGIQGDNWVSSRSGVDGIRMTDCGGSRVKAKVKDCGAQGILIGGASAGHYTVEATVTGCAASGIYARAGADVVLGDSTVVSGNGTVATFAAGVNADTGARIRISGKVIGNKAYGVQSFTAGSIVTIAGATIRGNPSGNVRQATGGLIRYENAKFSDDPLSGVMTIVEGERTVKVLNKNMIDPNRIVLAPANEAGREAGVPLLATYTPEESFTFQVKNNVTSDAGWRWALI